MNYPLVLSTAMSKTSRHTTEVSLYIAMTQGVRLGLGNSEADIFPLWKIWVKPESLWDISGSQSQCPYFPHIKNLHNGPTPSDQD